MTPEGRPARVGVAVVSCRPPCSSALPWAPFVVVPSSAADELTGTAPLARVSDESPDCSLPDIRYTPRNGITGRLTLGGTLMPPHPMERSFLHEACQHDEPAPRDLAFGREAPCDRRR